MVLVAYVNRLFEEAQLVEVVSCLVVLAWFLVVFEVLVG